MPSRSYHRQESLAAWLFLTPSLAGTTLFVLAPFAETVRRSFFDTSGKSFVGFSNYQAVLGNEAFGLAVYNTARFIVICVPLLLLISLALALGVRALRQPGKPRRGQMLKTTYLLPMAIPVASIVLLWQTLFAQKGLFNTLLGAFGAPAVDFMGSSAAFWVLIATYLWKNSGYDMILWLAGLDGIPGDLYEAAAVDGAGALQAFFAVTLPGLLPTMALTAVLSLLNTFKVFREAYLVAGAYPHESMYLLQHLFNNWFLALDLPRLAAAAVLVALALLGLILLVQKFWTGDDR